MTEFVLEALPREPRGKGGARQVRREGNVPAVIYGVKEPLAVQVSEPDAARLVHHLHGSSQLVTLRLTGNKSKRGEEIQVLIKEVQTTPVGERLLHIDFNEIASDHKVRVGVEEGYETVSVAAINSVCSARARASMISSRSPATIRSSL